MQRVRRDVSQMNLEDLAARDLAAGGSEDFRSKKKRKGKKKDMPNNCNYTNVMKLPRAN